MRDAGMSAHRRSRHVIGGYRPSANARTLILGSHIDTVRQAGAYDGNLGVVTAIEVVRRLHASDGARTVAIEVAAFGDEEGLRFPSTLGGSARSRGASILRSSTSATPRAFRVATLWSRSVAIRPGSLRKGAARADVVGYVEAHIEQGPVLEAENRPVGIVTAMTARAAAR